MLGAWWRDPRRTARFACVAVALSIPLPLWNAHSSILRTVSTNPQFKPWIFPLLAVGYLYALIPLVFFFALSRNDAPLRTSHRLRLLSLAVAVAAGILMAEGLIRWIASLPHRLRALQGPDWKTGGSIVSAVAQDPRIVGLVSEMLTLLSVAALISVLIALFRRADDDAQPGRSPSRLLMSITKLSVIAGGIVVAFFSIRVLATPYTYFSFRDLAQQNGRDVPYLFGRLFTDTLRDLTAQVTIWAAPFVVYRSIPRSHTTLRPRPIEEEAE